MYKIRKIQFKNHPILKNLKLDFCDKLGKAVDTVIFAGENGTGKSTVLECLYKFASRKIDFEVDIEVEDNEKIYFLSYYNREIEGKEFIWVKDNEGLNVLQSNNMFGQKYNFSGIFSDVDINFHSQNVNTVTSMTLDSESESRKSNNDLPKLIKQLIVDIQSLDDSELSRIYREAKEKGMDTNNILIEERMPRFTSAFNNIFSDLMYSRVENVGGHKEILFTKEGVDIPIDGLSSGEKQIVYRGCFLLKDAKSLDGTFVFIDEPEISLHPLWQQKIMDYYKGIYSDKDGKQTSQIFVVTHSPFIIHNKSRKNDKVIVTQRNNNGEIIISDKPEYYKCECIEAVNDAFSISDFILISEKETSVVYLEGRTDEKYFNKALEIYGYEQVPFKFKWIGYMDEKGQEVNTGKDNLNKVAQFLISQNLPLKNVCLFDCDVNHVQSFKNNVICKNLSYYCNSKNIKKGIENALILDNIDISPYYSYKEKEGEYGEKSIISQFDKMKFCDNICLMENDVLREIFSNLKKEIDELIKLFELN